MSDLRNKVALRFCQGVFDTCDLGMSCDTCREMADATIAEIEPEMERLRAENARLRGVIEADRSEVASALCAFRAAANSYSWLVEGRGSYAYDDDRYQREFGSAMEAMRRPLETLSRLASDWSDCPVAREDIEIARCDRAHGALGEKADG